MKKAIISVAALLALTACSVKDAVQVPDSPLAIPMGCEITLTARCAAPDGDSKTVRQPDGKIYWNPGDKIYVYNSASNFGDHAFTSLNSQPSPTASFTGVLHDYDYYTGKGWTGYAYMTFPFIVALTSYDTMNKAGFGPNLSGDWSKDDYGNNAWPPVTLRATCKIPDQQTATLDNLNLLPSMAISHTTDLQFHHYAGGFKVSVINSNISSVEIKLASKVDNPDSYSYPLLCGNRTLEIDYNSQAVSFKTVQASYGSHQGEWFDSDSRSSIITPAVLNAPSGQTLVPGEYYHLICWPCLLEGGITITLRTSEGQEMSRTISKDLEIKTGRFLVLNNVDAGLDQGNSVGGGIEDFTYDPII